MAESFRELFVWQQAMELVEMVYASTERFPKSEDYALKSQMRRAAVSIPSNIAEGSAKDSGKEFRYFLRVVKGSARELDTQIEIAQRVGYLQESEAHSLQDKLASVGKLLTNLIKSIPQE